MFPTLTSSCSPKAIKHNAYFRGLEADMRKADLANATMGEELDKALLELKQLTTVSAFKEVSTKIPVWVDSFRDATSKKLLRSFEESAHRLWPVVLHRASLDEMQNLASHLRTLPVALGAKCPESLPALEGKVTAEVQQTKCKQRQEQLLHTLQPFINGQHAEAQSSIECEHHEEVCKTMGEEK